MKNKSLQNKNHFNERCKLLSTVAGTLIPVSFGIVALLGSGKIYGSSWLPYGLLISNLLFAATIFFTLFVFRSEDEKEKKVYSNFVIGFFFIGLLILIFLGFGLTYRISIAP